MACTPRLVRLEASGSAVGSAAAAGVVVVAPDEAAAGTDREDWELLMTVGRRETYMLGDTVIADGDASEFIYRLVSGEVSVEKGRGNSLLALRRGDMMGELSFLDASLPACASCVVSSAVAELDCVPKAELRAAIEGSPHLAAHFYRFICVSLCRRLRDVARAAVAAHAPPQGTQPRALPPRSYLSAKQLRRHRLRLGVADAERLVGVFDAVSVSMRTGLCIRGAIFVFESKVGFVARVLALSHAETWDLRQVSECALDLEEGKVTLGFVEGASAGRDEATLLCDQPVELYRTIDDARTALRARAAGAGDALAPEQLESDLNADALMRAAFDTVAAEAEVADGLASMHRGARLRPSRTQLSALPRLLAGKEVTGGGWGARGGAAEGPDSDDDDDELGALSDGESAADALRVLLEGSTLDRFLKGGVIVQEGLFPHKLFQVAQGSVSVRKARMRRGSLVSAHVHTLHAGAYFCEMCLLTGAPAACSIVAESAEVEIVSVSARHTHELLRARPAAAAPFFEHLATHLAHRIRLVTRLSGQMVNDARAHAVTFEQVVTFAPMLAQLEAANAAEGWVAPELFYVLRALNGCHDIRDQPAATQARAAAALYERYVQPNLEPTPTPLPQPTPPQPQAQSQQVHPQTRAEVGGSNGAHVDLSSPSARVGRGSYDDRGTSRTASGAWRTPSAQLLQRATRPSALGGGETDALALASPLRSPASTTPPAIATPPPARAEPSAEVPANRNRRYTEEFSNKAAAVLARRFNRRSMPPTPSQQPQLRLPASLPPPARSAGRPPAGGLRPLVLAATFSTRLMAAIGGAVPSPVLARASAQLAELLAPIGGLLRALERGAHASPLRRDAALGALREAVEARIEALAFGPFVASPYVHPLLMLRRREAHTPSIGDFTLLRILGEGYEGQVLQARKRDCGVMYALKVLDKNVLASRSRRWGHHASNERRVLIECAHHHIVQLAYCFQSARYLYFALEYLPSTTLARYIERHALTPVPVVEIRYVLAQLVLALGHMHSRLMLYRDLKPANVLLDAQGKVRLVDMGMATITEGEMRNTVCGTQRYMAPEMKAKKAYDSTVDWFSLGKLAADFARRSGTLEKHFRSGALADLIEGLTSSDAERRLGAGGAEAVRSHPFFDDMRWDLLDRNELPSPLKESYYRVDVAVGRQAASFKNGDDVKVMIEKLQSLKMSETETGPGMIDGWNYASKHAVYREYAQSPFQNLALSS